MPCPANTMLKCDSLSRMDTVVERDSPPLCSNIVECEALSVGEVRLGNDGMVSDPDRAICESTSTDTRLQRLSEKEAKSERATSNPFELLQSRCGRQGLGYRVTQDEVSTDPKTTVYSHDVCRGRPRRSKSGKVRDAQKRDIFIKNKINENTKQITNSLAATAAGIANSYGQQVLQLEKNTKRETFSLARKFIFEHCKASSLDISTEGGWKKFAKHVEFNVPSGAEMYNMPFDKVKYIGRLSPELLRLLIMYRVCVNGMTYHPLYDSVGERGSLGVPRHMKNGLVLSEIAEGVKKIGERLMRLCIVKVFSTDPRERGDHYYDETMLAQDTVEVGI